MSNIIQMINAREFPTRNRFKKQHLRDESLNNLPPHPEFSKQIISHAGFYNNDGNLICFKCGLQINHRDLSASTFREHKVYSTICAPFQPNTGNIEVEEDSSQQTLEERQEIELFPIKSKKFSEPEEENSAYGTLIQMDKEILYRMLKRENLYLKDRITCCSCKSENASYLILPCGDLGACRGCIKTIEACPICTTAVMDGKSLTFKYESEDEEEPEKEFINEDKDVKGIQFLMA